MSRLADPRPSRRRFAPDQGRRAVLLTLVAIGAIVAVVVLAIIRPNLYPLSYLAVCVIGSVTGLALHVLMRVVDRPPAL